MSNDVSKSLLMQFYGFNECPRESNFLSSSKGIEEYQNVTDIEHLSADNAQLSSNEIGQNQNEDEKSEETNHESNDEIKESSRSPNILTINEIFEEDEEDENADGSSVLNVTIVEDIKEEKPILTTNYTKLEDVFMKAMVQVSEAPSNKADPVITAKKLWRQKTMQSKGKLLNVPSLLSKFDGIHLNVSNCGLSTFPIDILQRLTTLKMLYLDSNELTKLPEEFFPTLRHLKWLDVRNNQLTSIPSSIKNHPFLETLLLQKNNIEKLPLELGLVPKLKNLQTAYNPLTFPPREILDADCPTIINFLRREWNEEHEDDAVELKKPSMQLKKKESTILCCREASKKSTSYRLSSASSSIKPVRSTSARSRSWSYKPSSRCESVGGDVVLQQKIIWMKTAKKLLCDQAIELQKNIDKRVLNTWRWNYSHLNKEKCIKGPLKAPFALHEESFQDSEMSQCQEHSKSNSRNLQESFNDLMKSFEDLDNTKMEIMTPCTERNKLQSEIEKMTQLIRKLQDLKYYSDLGNIPYKYRENTQKTYIPPPSIII